MMLICGDWSDWSHFNFIMPVMPDRSAAKCTVLPGHLVAKNEFAFSFRPTQKDQQVVGQYVNVSC